ncbi:MAG: zinc ABC transporter substrate-binding protein [Candidatus Improbicoccus pseudotrichonymphae]|uniref:Zinc ABC transporter substrate-binding protein n=1 Tax=Candidatus Improbicoccus pseudotrichonymphae TaxID=3033792 RepID=A0AA48I2G8_9FIRM|nr:MAG: zinc ABC transporter substrate-binding protein [Candidatus Improbicoccus pseudotrichonymphae]
MKKLLTFIFAFILTLCLFFIFRYSNNHKDNNTKITLVSSFYPLHIAVLNLIDGIDDIESVNITKDHVGCIHDVSLQVNDMKKIENAKAFIINGAGLEESFVQDISEKLPNVPIIDSGKNIELLKVEDEDENYDKEYDHHIWLSLSNHIKQIENIAQELVKILPEYSDKISKNKDLYKLKLEELGKKYNSESMRNKKIIVNRAIFSYFAKEYGLEISFIVNNGHHSEPSAKEITEIIEFVKKNGICYIFTEEKNKSVETIAQETAIKIINLDPIRNGPERKNAYLDAMENNLKILKGAF